jgi:NAD(P)-dependent dehydrogenase (short-subunit alcohol dehydrogenase family)
MPGVRFRDKVAIVTGAGVGIGQAIATSLAGAGARVAIVDRDRDAADAVAASIGSDQAFAVEADVASPESTRQMASAVKERFGRIDVLVNNAGIRHIAPFAEMTFETWQSTIDVNLTGTFLCTQAVVSTMLEQGRGKVVNVASTTGVLALTKRSAYAASKAGVIGLTKALAFELSSQGIWVNAVAPGPTETPMNAPYFRDAEMRGILLKEIPLGRWGQPDEVSSAVLFLASDDSDYVCGAVLAVDGGWLSGKGY